MVIRNLTMSSLFIIAWTYDFGGSSHFYCSYLTLSMNGLF